jgi:hypothetical protein
MGQYEQISFMLLSMTVTVLIFMKFTNGSAADTRSQTDDGLWSPSKMLFFTSYRI